VFIEKPPCDLAHELIRLGRRYQLGLNALSGRALVAASKRSLAVAPWLIGGVAMQLGHPDGVAMQFLLERILRVRELTKYVQHPRPPKKKG
jgi:hypothetical protein